jgi:hypothetical protein
MKKVLHLSLIVVMIGLIYGSLITSFSSCKKGHRLDCFKGNGSEITEVRNPGKFRMISVNDKIEVTIVQGPECKVEVTAGEHIMKNITTEIRGDSILVMENTSRCNFVRGYKKKVHIKVTMPYVSWIGNYSVSSIKMAPNFVQDSLLFVRNENSGDTYIYGDFKTITTSSHGNGDIYLTGTAKYLNVYMFGTNFTHSENFTVSEVLNISTLSVGDAYINLNTTKRLEYYIWKSGSINYLGTPLAIVNLGEGEANGKGKLVKQD